MNQTMATTAPGGGPAAAASPEPYRRRMRNLLVDANLQLRLASYLVGLAAAIQVALGVLLWRAYQETSAVIALADPAIGQLMAQEDRRRMLWIAVGFALVVVAMLSLALVVTHRVAGPAFYLTRACRKVSEGRYQRLRPLRKRDLLVPLADEIGAMIEALRERDAKEQATLAAVTARLRRPGASPTDLESADALEALAAEKAKRIGA